jgi:hypothetical protein
MKQDAWSLVCRLFVMGGPTLKSNLSPRELTELPKAGHAIKPGVMDHRYILCPHCGLQNGEVCSDGKGGRECRCPECGPVYLDDEDFAALVIDDEWLQRALRRALDINSRDGITQLAEGVWRLGHLKDTPVVLTRDPMVLLPALLDRVRVVGKGIEVIAPRVQYMPALSMGPADVQWLPLEERFAIYGGGIRFIQTPEPAPSLPPADPTKPVHGPFSADFKWVTLPGWEHGLIRCTEGQAKVFKALWSFKGEPMPAERIMDRAGLQSDKLIHLFKVKACDKDKPEAQGPLFAYRTLVSTHKREGLYAMTCAENSLV